MEAFFVSAAVIAVAEIGDKTQLLALMLAARYRKPVPIILGILLATLANHALAAWIGAAVAGWVGADTMRWILGAAFIVMAGWCLIPDKADDGPQAARQAGAFLATLVAFFIVEIVTAGTTVGMLLVNVPVVLFGDAIAKRLPLKIVHAVAAFLFLVLGLAAFFMPSAP
jgi:putative Ca2+/H+ antiporter (TMEM165/GDT1 family)